MSIRARRRRRSRRFVIERDACMHVVDAERPDVPADAQDPMDSRAHSVAATHLARWPIDLSTPAPTRGAGRPSSPLERAPAQGRARDDLGCRTTTASSAATVGAEERAWSIGIRADALRGTAGVRPASTKRGSPLEVCRPRADGDVSAHDRGGHVRGNARTGVLLLDLSGVQISPRR